MDGIDTVKYNDNPAEELSLRVVRKIAEREGKSPTELTPSLHSVIDPDALDSLFNTAHIDGREASIRFTYCGYDVCVRSDGEITVVAT